MDLPSSTHPPLPPTTEDDRIAWLRLLRSRRVGIATFYRLITEYGTAQCALQALPDIARKAGEHSYEPCSDIQIISELQSGEKCNARPVFRGEADYPKLLMSIQDAPPVLWVRGELSLSVRPVISIVGARNASSLGVRMARKLAIDLGAQGYIIASGLARGIDAAAHEGALETGTVAVVAGGVDTVYPQENAHLTDKIAQHGLLLSEQPIGTTAQARHFPTRNRIVSAIALALIVVEAAGKSGSLITARTALDQGRDVLAVPGHPSDARAAGCNMLIRDGATLIRSADDVVEALSPLDQPALSQETTSKTTFFPSQSPKYNLTETDILSRLNAAPTPEDQLIRDIGCTVSEIAPLILDLELNGHITRHPGGFLSLPMP